MNQPNSDSSTAPDVERLQRDLAGQIDLVQSVRQELIRSQITVLELQDTVLQKETDKADAVALLGQAELVLEGKINYIFELDRVLNERIAAVQQQLQDARRAHDSITADLVQRLDQTNQQLGAAHTLAAGYAQDSAQTREQLNVLQSSLEQLRTAHGQTEAQLKATRADLAQAQTQLAETAHAKAALESKLAAIHRSWSWKLTSVFRSHSDRS